MLLTFSFLFLLICETIKCSGSCRPSLYITGKSKAAVQIELKKKTGLKFKLCLHLFCKTGLYNKKWLDLV